MRASPTFLLAVFLAAFVVFRPAPADAQVRTYRIQGEVVDASSGQPMAGVQVQIRGTSQGTLTNADGRYRIAATLPQGDYTLSYTFIGRTTATVSVSLGMQSAVTVPTVSLEESAVALEELVVTATGVQSVRRSIGNTVESVTGDVINEAIGASTLDQALQGKLLGAWISEHSGQPGGGTSIRLRGVNSIFGGAEPLIVIDGIIVDNSNEALVSLSGNAGRGGQGLVNRLADLAPSDIERVEVLKGAAAAALYGSRANNGVIQIFTKSGQQGDTRITFSTEMSLGQVADEYDFNMHPRAGLGDLIWGTDVSGLLDPVERFNLQDRLWRDAWSTQNHVSVSGGSENTTFYAAGNLETEEGILESTDFERRSIRAKVSHQVTDRLELGAMGNFLQTEFGFMPEGEQTSGTLTAAIFTPTSWDFRFDENLGRYPRNTILGANPLDVFENWDATDQVTRFAGNLNATFRATDAFTIRYLFGIDDYRQETHFFRPPQSTSAGDRGLVQSPIRLSRQVNSDLTATLVSELSDDFSLESTGGIRYTEDQANIIRAATADLPPGQNTLSGATQFASQGLVEFRTFGGFLQEQLAYQDRLYFNVGLNVEGSSAFGADQRWQLFPKANVSWVVHESDFWEGGIGDALNTLRLRAAYGETGGQPPGAFDRFNNFIPVAYSGNAGLVASGRAGNPNLEPEQAQEWEIGADVGFLDDRAQLEVTYYSRTTDNLVLPVQLPPSRGVQSQFQNVGEVENSGWELALSTVDWDIAGINWRSRLQLSANDNVVKNLVAADDTLTFGYLNIVTEGQPVGAFYGWYYARDANGDIVIDPSTGLGQRALVPVVDEQGNVIDSIAGRKILGDPNPDLIASFSNTFSLGDSWELNVLLDGRFGNEVADFSRRIMEFFGSHVNVEQEIQRALEREDNPDLQPIQYTLNVDRLLNYEEYVEDGSFIKLREVGLSYRAPPDLAGRFFGAESATIRLAGRNLVTWTDYGGLDPEVNVFSGNTVARGVDFATTPLPRQYSLSFQFVF